MTDDGESPISRLQSVAIWIAIIALAAVTFGSVGLLAFWLPFWLEPLALVPILLFARYGAGNSWLESGCLVIMIGLLIAAFTAIGSLAKHLTL